MTLVEQARRPPFYATLGVPDTVDGRFEMIALHMFLVLHRLKNESVADGFSQALFDTMFADMDRSLREMGVSDLSVGRHVKAMAQGLYGRMAAYEAGLAGSDDAALADALRRNVYGTLVTPPDAGPLAGYIRANVAALGAQRLDELLAGRPRFTDPLGAAIH
jgi:cytochrome b pre-mRNA-processing protein 3